MDGDRRIKIPCSGEKAAQRLGVIFLEEGWSVHIGKEAITGRTTKRYYIEIWKEI